MGSGSATGTQPRATLPAPLGWRRLMVTCSKMENS